MDAMEAKEEIYERAEFNDADNDMLGELECVVAEEDGYTAESDAAVLLDGLGIESEFQEDQMKHLQGGLKLLAPLRRRYLVTQKRCFLTNRPTIWTSTRFVGSRSFCSPTTAPSSSLATTGVS